MGQRGGQDSSLWLVSFLLTMPHPQIQVPNWDREKLSTKIGKMVFIETQVRH